MEEMRFLYEVGGGKEGERETKQDPLVPESYRKRREGGGGCFFLERRGKCFLHQQHPEKKRGEEGEESSGA